MVKGMLGGRAGGGRKLRGGGEEKDGVETGGGKGTILR